MSPLLRLFALSSAGVLLLSAVGVFAFVRLGGPLTARGATVVAAGQAAPDFTLQDAATGKAVRLSSLRGRPVIVNFWATWCGPCRLELPALEKAYRSRGANGGEDFEVLAVDVRESPAAVTTFRKSIEMTFPVLLDRSGATYERYGATVLPRTYFIDRDGIVRARHDGALSPSDLVRGLEWARE